jgi:UDP-N-acetylmuramoylalanine--D-glutamate ligase
MCKAYFEPRGQRVFLGGNVRGLATLPLLKEVKRNDILVLELSSWQLQGFGEAKLSPHIAVFTNLMADHMNYYKNDMEAYLADKAQIFLHQKQRDFLVAGETAAHLIVAKYHGKLFHPPEAASASGIPSDWKIAIPGVHNRENIALAIRVGKLLSIPYESIKTSVEGFKGVEGRLEYLGQKQGVNVYNDNNSTTPEATIAALKALGGEGKADITLIMGGADKTLDMSKLVELLPRYCSKVVLLPGTGTDKLSVLSSQLSAESSEKLTTHNSQLKTIFRKAETLGEAVEEAFKDTKKGETVLFSPAFASFGLFKNEYDRNDQFKAIIEKMK